MLAVALFLLNILWVCEPFMMIHEQRLSYYSSNTHQKFTHIRSQVMRLNAKKVVIKAKAAKKELYKQQALKARSALEKKISQHKQLNITDKRYFYLCLFLTYIVSLIKTQPLLELFLIINSPCI
jgi:hypothetical protein